MEAPYDLQVTLGRPAAEGGVEPDQPVYARLRVVPRAELSVRPRLDLCFVLDASASMHRFVLDPAQRALWQQRAEQRGEIVRQVADGRTGMVWSGQTLRELQQHVSTPMLSTLRGVWRTLEALQTSDGVSVLAFADQPGVIYEDAGVADRGMRLQQAKQCLTRLGSGVDESGLGRGTRLSGALQHAIDRLSGSEAVPSLRRIVLVSDGIIQDAEECRRIIDSAMIRGIVISVIGVGDEFDEEYLMSLADLTRGSYYYAATAPEVEQAVSTELVAITRVAGRQAHLRVLAENGAILHDVYPISPELSEFQTVWVENGCWRFRIGDLCAATPPEFLIELAAPNFPSGELRLARAQVEAMAPISAEACVAEAPIQLLYTGENMLLQARDDEVLDTLRKLDVYRAERRAAEASSHGDQESATKHLRAATRMLRSMGADSLADDMAAAADDTESGTRNLSRTKRVKAGTRRLGSR